MSESTSTCTKSNELEKEKIAEETQINITKRIERVDEYFRSIGYDKPQIRRGNGQAKASSTKSTSYNPAPVPEAPKDPWIVHVWSK